MPVARKKKSVEEASPIPEVEKPKRPQDWTALERAEVVLKASRLSAQEVGEFLRSQGLHLETLQEWERALEESVLPQTARGSRALTDAKRIRELERDLARKDRALAETAALLILKKKMALFWGDEDDETDPKSDE